MEIKALFIIFASMLITANAEWNLEDSRVTALAGSVATLSCKYNIPENSTGNLLQSWFVAEENKLIFFEKKGTAASDERMTVSFDDVEMTLTIDGVTLDDEKEYKCELNGIDGSPSAIVELTVNQHPQSVYVEDYPASPIEGTTAHVATCMSKGSKPKPRIWFTDEYGNIEKSLDEVEDTALENGLYNSVAKLRRVFYKNENGMKYRCHVEHIDGNEMTKETAPVDVRYATTASLDRVDEGEHKEMLEGERLDVLCVAEGNPSPTIVWSFTPDPSLNMTMDEDQILPEGFAVSGDGSMVMEAVAITSESSTHNGTFQCMAGNGVGDDVILSFRLGVYAAPVTTVATTPGATPQSEPRAAGSDAAVIGGVVAVAVFILIVAVVLIARYFMSHKGTYHTHEIKARDMEENGDEDEHPMVDDDDEIVEKKRTEYFM